MNNSIKEMLIKRLELEISIDEFSDDMPLFEGGLELDSIEALEIIVGLEQLFNIKIEELENPAEDFYSVETIIAMVNRLKSEQSDL
jgi:acyl carrier protein